MKRIIFGLILGLVITSCGTEEDEPLKEPSPADINEENPAELSFDEEAWDFGEITQGEVVEHDYSFTNTGKSDLVIVDAKSSCGCTIPEIPKEPIKPGESGKIGVRFNSTGKGGKIKKVIRVSANTHPKTVTEIELTGVVLAPKTD